MLFGKRGRNKAVVYGLVFLILLINAMSTLAADSKSVARVPLGGDGSQGSSTGLPDLFTGAMSYSIPIEVPLGRRGMDPAIALEYQSNKGNGWIGFGWDLEVGAIQRSTKRGVDYNGDSYVLLKGGSVLDLVNVGDDEYLLAIEGEFSRIKKSISEDGLPRWDITDKKGMRFIYGQTTAARQDNPTDPNHIFKWCLNRIEDTNGNFLDVRYSKDQGQIYLSEIHYAGNSNNDVTPSNKITFELDLRPDVSEMYTTNFKVITQFRLKRINVFATDILNNRYELQYTANVDSSQLSKIGRVGSDGVTVLPDIQVTWQKEADGSVSADMNSSTYAAWGESSNRIRPVDVNGDGKQDIVIGPDTTGNWYVLQAAGTRFVDKGAWITGAYGAWEGASDRIRTMDVNGDGKQDIVIGPDTTGNWYVLQSTGSSFVDKGAWITGAYGAWERASDRIRTMDVNGDGKQDIVIGPDNYGNWYALQSTGSSFVDKGAWITGAYGAWQSSSNRVRTMDVNGDGLQDIVIGPDSAGKWYVLQSTGSSFVDKGAWITGAYGAWEGASDRIRTMDLNGDGKQDIVIGPDASGNWYALQSTGSSFVDKGAWITGAYGAWQSSSNRVRTMDVNGDGLQDIFIGPDHSGNWFLLKSTGKSFVDKGRWLTGVFGAWADSSNIRAMYATGGSGNDIVVGPDSAGWWRTVAFNNQMPNLVSSISNGLGKVVSIGYAPSTKYFNTQLPFTVQTVASIKLDAGNGKVSTTNYTYNGGYYKIGESDFRGFNWAKFTGPAGPNLEQRITETWFHQGNDTASDANNPGDSVGYMKGKAYRVLETDATGKKFSEVKTGYTPDNDGLAPYYTPPLQVDSYSYDGSQDARVSRTVYASYDPYGNLLEEHQYGDISDSTDDRTMTTGYGYNLTSWIVALPTTKSVYAGIGIADASKVSSTEYYYDVVDNDVSGCSQTSTSQTPAKGNMTRAVYWNKDGINPERRTAYDTYGNPVCSRDANGYTSTISYDVSKTYPRIIINPLGHQSTTQYYGVDGVIADKGLYGQIKSTTDPNNAASSFEYDVFGRPTLAIQPDGFWTKTQYLNFGNVSIQNVRTDNSLGLWSESYFDGQGRTYKTRESGPDEKVIMKETKYDERGAVAQSSFPYFENLETPRYIINAYDPLGRITQTYNQAEQNSSTMLACYNNGVNVTIDSENHRKRETFDVYGRLAKIEEYTGTFTTCSADALTPYATTTYVYDPMGNLTHVTDAKNNVTTIVYDTLGRKSSMEDPDMGDWSYEYDGNGNLTFQTDAKLQKIEFRYDALNRNTYKIYPDQTYTEYAYDQTFSSNFRGRLTTMSDASGTTKYYYDLMGRNTRLIKNIDGSNYILDSDYDGLGRIKWLQYPDNERVTYSYNTGGSLYQVGSYATYSGYNALRQKGTATNGNGVTSSYQYYPANNRLYSITTNSPTAGGLLNLAYTYYNMGNVKTIVDDSPSTALDQDSVTLTYGHPSKPHAVTTTTSGRSYSYDYNGNVLSDGVRTIQYNYDNMPVTINGGAISFVYDGSGARVKKITSGGTKLYLGKYYECVAGVCGKYIFAGEDRVALKTPTEVLYYHPDHLGSTSVATDVAGNKVEELKYHPFGKSSYDAGSVRLNHKFTSQELDEETGLYNYRARLYDPEIGRFISPDTIVPDPTNPQSLNRYSYVLNNPLRYTDPTGHSWKDFWRGVNNLFKTGYWSGEYAPNTYSTNYQMNSGGGTPSSNDNFSSQAESAWDRMNSNSGGPPPSTRTNTASTSAPSSAIGGGTTGGASGNSASVGSGNGRNSAIVQNYSAEPRRTGFTGGIAIDAGKGLSSFLYGGAKSSGNGAYIGLNNGTLEYGFLSYNTNSEKFLGFRAGWGANMTYYNSSADTVFNGRSPYSNLTVGVYSSTIGYNSISGEKVSWSMGFGGKGYGFSREEGQSDGRIAPVR